MAAQAVRGDWPGNLLGPALPADHGPALVQRRRHRLKMPGVDAQSVVTEVVDVEVISKRTVQSLVSDAVGVDGPPLDAEDPVPAAGLAS